MELLKVENLTFTYPKQAKGHQQDGSGAGRCLIRDTGRGIYSCLRGVGMREDDSASALEEGTGPCRGYYRKDLVLRCRAEAAL